MTSTLERTLRVGTLLTTASIVVQAFINIFKKSIENITDNFSHLLNFSTEIDHELFTNILFFAFRFSTETGVIEITLP